MLIPEFPSSDELKGRQIETASLQVNFNYKGQIHNWNRLTN